MVNDKMDGYLDIIKLVKQLRELRILSNNCQNFDIMKSFQVDHSHKCVMNLESDGESINSSLTECSGSEDNEEGEKVEKRDLGTEGRKG